jgi:hypothetical protein
LPCLPFWVDDNNTTYTISAELQYNGQRIYLTPSSGSQSWVTITGNGGSGEGPIQVNGSSEQIYVGIVSASTTAKGAVQLTDSTSTTSSVLAATATGVKSAYDLANGKVSQTNGTVTTASTSSGVVRNIYTSTSAPTGGSDGDVWLVYTA